MPRKLQSLIGNGKKNITPQNNMKISKDLNLPKNALTQKLGWIGTSGGGKTYAAMKLAECFWDAKAQFIVLDPVGVWYGLRLAKGGKKPSDINIPVLGGLHGDIPLEATSGALIADLVVDKHISAILDVSQFESDADKARFATAFADRFFFRKKASPSAVHLFIEECQEFVPQNPQREENRMLHAFTRMQKIGRNFGIGTSLITQRPQEVSKRALNLAGTLFVFRTTGSHERKAIEIWMQDKSIESKEILADMPKFDTGVPYVWSPEWLKISRKVHIAEKRTFDASATPEVGARAVRRELAPIDLERIKTDMAATIEKAKADDPKLLRAEIARLTREREQERLHPLKVAVPVKDTPMGVSQWRDYGKKYGYWEFFERQINQAAGKQWEEVVKAWKNYATRLLAVLASTGLAVKNVETKQGELLDKIPVPTITTPTGWMTPSNLEPAEKLTTTYTPGKEKSPVLSYATMSRPMPDGEAFGLPGLGDGDAVLKAGARKMLAVIVARHPMRMTKSQFATLSGMSPKSSTFQQYLSALRRNGLISSQNGIYTATDKGIAECGDTKPTPQSPDELRTMWRGSLKAGAAKLLGILIDQNRIPLTKDNLAQMATMSMTSSTFEQYVSVLNRNGLIEKVDGGLVAAEIFY